MIFNALKNTKHESNNYLAAAEKIGKRLCKEAYWFDNQCNWMGRGGDAEYPYKVVSFALDSYIYDGASGIALFLSYLYFLTRKDSYRVTAEGAINKALLNKDSTTKLQSFGFYNGILGIAYVATQIGAILNNNYLLERSLEIILYITRQTLDGPHTFDVIGGNAGAIPPLLDLSSYFHEEKILNFAVTLGNELVDNAVKEPAGFSWVDVKNIPKKSNHNLTGFSHGAAGIGYSLLELFLKTDNKKYLGTAKKAFDYENYWYNQDNNNWPDFRGDASEKSKKKSKDSTQSDFPYFKSWCHGAPGIGLSRLRAYKILGNGKYLTDGHNALKLTKELVLDDKKNTFTDNYSLCHGLGGLCELFLQGNSILKSQELLSLARIVGDKGISEYHNKKVPWPCGIFNREETPGLMTGLAGIGYFYLRLYDPITIPSILMIVPK